MQKVMGWIPVRDSLFFSFSHTRHIILKRIAGIRSLEDFLFEALAGRNGPFPSHLWSLFLKLGVRPFTWKIVLCPG